MITDKDIIKTQDKQIASLNHHIVDVEAANKRLAEASMYVSAELEKERADKAVMLDGRDIDIRPANQRLVKVIHHPNQQRAGQDPVLPWDEYIYE